MDHVDRRRGEAPVIIGSALVIIGIVILFLRQAGMDIEALIDGENWPLLVIVPGLVLLVSAFLVAPQQGLGLTIAGAVVTSVGLILLYQQSTSHWESWAYAWALIPTAIGVAMAGYGAVRGQRDVVPTGLRMAAIGAVMFVAGFWFFETIFESGRAPIDLWSWWPAILIGAGVLMVATTLLRPGKSDSPA
jgi:hypothetical protein